MSSLVLFQGLMVQKGWVWGGRAGPAAWARSATLWEPLGLRSPSRLGQHRFFRIQDLLYFIFEGGSLLLPASVVIVGFFQTANPQAPATSVSELNSFLTGWSCTHDSN